jgi:hypothetical protein
MKIVSFTGLFDRYPYYRRIGRMIQAKPVEIWRIASITLYLVHASPVRRHPPTR